MQLDWEKKIPGMKVYVLCPHGDWRDGTVIAYTDGLVSVMISFFFKFNNSSFTLRTLYSCPKVDDKYINIWIY